MNFTRNNDQGEKKVVRDQPTMRSVVIRSSSSFDYPSGLAARSSASQYLESKQAPSSSHGTNHSLSKNPPIESWKVSDNSVKALPDMYPLERTNAAVLNATAQQVMDRIAESLRQQSIAATFDAEKAAVQAESRDHVRFIVRLFKVSNETVVVEVQRRCGCSYVFHQCSDAILNAAQGIKKTRCMPKFTIPDCVKAAAAAAAVHEEGDHEANERRAAESDLECALQLWKNDRYDAQLLGLESLILLSQQKHLAAFSAHSLLCSKCVQDKLLALVNQTEDLVDCDTMEMEHLIRMRRHALTVLANCLEALGDSGELQHVMEKNEAFRSPKLLDTFVAALSTAEQAPHDAHEAARCLASLCRCCSICREHAVDMGAPEAVTRALDVGMIRHALLEGASRRLQGEMGFS